MSSKTKTAKRKTLAQGLCICGKMIIGMGFVYLLLLVVDGFGVNIIQEDKWGENVAIALAVFSVGLGLLAWGLGEEAGDRMKAMARLEFREKIAMMHDYMGDEKKRRKYDIEAAEELKDWVSDDLRKEYGKLRKKYDDFIDTEGVGETGRSKEYNVHLHVDEPIKVQYEKSNEVTKLKIDNKEIQSPHTTSYSGEIIKCEGVIKPQQEDAAKG